MGGGEGCVCGGGGGGGGLDYVQSLARDKCVMEFKYRLLLDK